jgi:hypothetical protein
MHRVNSQAVRPLSEMKFAAVAVGIGHPQFPNQLHAGIFHAAENAPPEMLDLAFHCILRNDAPESRYHWVQPPFDESRLRQLSAFCRRVWRKNSAKGLPYGFGLPNAVFDPVTGEYLMRESQYGLTCASFVFAVFHAVGLQLADYVTWPAARAEDKAWQMHIISMLEQYAKDPPHVARVKDDIGAVRFHPQEVAASAAFAAINKPAAYADVTEAAETIRLQLAVEHINNLIEALDMLATNQTTSPETISAGRTAATQTAIRFAEKYRLAPLHAVAGSAGEIQLQYRHPFKKELVLVVEVTSHGVASASVLEGTTVRSSDRLAEDEATIIGRFLDAE